MSDPNTGEPYGLQVDHLGRLMRCEAGRDPQGLGKILWTKQAYSGVIDSWEGSSVNDVFATGGYDEGPVLKLWRASSGTLRQSIPLPAWPVNVSIARDGSRVGALLEDGSVHIYDTVSGQAVAIPDVSSDQHVLALSGTGRYALLLQNGHDQIWNLDRGKVELTVPDEATGLEFTLDDHFVVWSTPQGLHSVVVGSGKAGPVVDGAAWNGALFTGIHPGEMVMVPSFGAGKVYRWSLEGQNAPVLIQSLSSLPVKTAPGIGADGLIIRVPHCDLSTFPQGK